MVTEKGRYPGYGIIYPQKSTSGLKYVKIVADGPKKIRHADGSVEMAPPRPTILELVGGAFAYASGQVVNRRSDLEWLPSGMKERALQWFDQQGYIPKEAVAPIPEQEKKVEPNPKWVLSSERHDLLDLEENKAEVPVRTREEPEMIDKSGSAVMSALDAILGKLGGLEERITLVEKGTPKQSDRLVMARKNQSETMKRKWAERKAAKEAALHVTDAGTEVVTDGGHTPETDEAVQAV